MTEEGFLSLVKTFLYEKEGEVRGRDEDCAVVEEAGFFRLYTADALVEGVHFRRGYFSPYALGFKLAAVNLSDIAAMGGTPEWALLILGFSSPPEEDFVREFYRGLNEALETFGARLVGGDTVRSRELWAGLFLVGRAERPILRRGARPGDLIYVSRPLGAAAAALRYFREGRDPPKDLKKAHLFPEPEVELGRTLAGEGLPTAMMDLSDGLLLDLSRLCRINGVGARLRDIPVADGATLEEALSGGEDYALLFTVPPEKESRLRDLAPRVLPVGEISPEPGIFLGDRLLSPAGFDHFASPGPDGPEQL